MTHTCDYKHCAGDGVGSRGGNVRDLDTARDLQAQQKEKRDWRDAIDEQIRRVLLETGYCHADDLDPLSVPPQHCNLKGTRLAWFRNQGFMEKTGAERKVAHKAANGRKAPIHRITPKGRRELTIGVGVSRGAASREAEDSTTVAGIHPGSQVAVGVGGGSAEASSPSDSVAAHSLHPGEQSAARVDSEHREGSAAKSHKPDGTLDRPGPFISGQSTGARSAVDPGGGPDVSSYASGDAARTLSLLPEPDPKAWAA